LFAPSGPLGTFSAKINLAYHLEVIDDRIRSQLHDLRELRNACAHSHHPISFDTPELANVAARLFAPKGILTKEYLSTRTLRMAFITECLVVEAIMLQAADARGTIDAIRDAFAKSILAPPHPGGFPDEPQDTSR
jgi:DNA-binding MltR family transcriptional regulator